MRLSRYFLPVTKETPADAQIVSHKLMLRAGLVRQTAAGIYAWLPLGLRVLKKIEKIVRQEQNRAGAVELLMPTIQSADLWRESQRYDAYGPEMLRIKDRHGREMLYGPTNEEMITGIFRDAVKSYRDLPRTLYHIQWKFRDEVRPRFGVMRGREFLMKDAYSFDLDYYGALVSYTRMLLAYLRTFQRLGLTAIPMRADTGPIGGNLSHEFIILARSGESKIYYDSDYAHFDWVGSRLRYSRKQDLEAFLEVIENLYGRTEEMHDPSEWSRVNPTRRREGRGIEVGHIFYFGSKYSEQMKLMIQMPDGQTVYPQMGSYGIGVSRIVGAIIEACADDEGIRWPISVAPFKVALINMRNDDAVCKQTSDALYRALRRAKIEVLYDDRDDRAGAKFASADLIGLPLQMIVGPRGVAKGEVEFKNRLNGRRATVSIVDAPSVAASFGRTDGAITRLPLRVRRALRDLGSSIVDQPSSDS